MAKASGDYTFEARRRGRAVLIRGTVLAPPGSEPYLIPSHHTRPKTRAFRLAFRNNNAEVPFVPQPVEHLEPEVPDFVDTLSILLPDDKTFTIYTSRRGQ